MSYTNASLGQAISALRAKRGLTQEELGRLAGYKDGPGVGVSISRIETGNSRPSTERLRTIAKALGTKVPALEQQAREVNNDNSQASTGQTAAKNPVSAGGVASTKQDSLKDRVRAVQQEVNEREQWVAEHAEAFNEAHDAALTNFFEPFVEFAATVDGAARPELAPDNADQGDDPDAQARQRFDEVKAEFGRTFLAGAAGVAAGTGAGAAAAYTTFLAVGAWGTASTGVSIASLSGIAATNATMAAIGGGSLASGGAGIAGGTALLGGIVAAPAALAAAGVVAWMIHRKRKEMAQKVEGAEQNLAATRAGYERLVALLPAATKVLSDIAVHGARALGRWQPYQVRSVTTWANMSEPDRNLFNAFSELCASQISVASINFPQLLLPDSDDLPAQSALVRTTIENAQRVVDANV